MNLKLVFLVFIGYFPHHLFSGKKNGTVHWFHARWGNVRIFCWRTVSFSVFELSSM